MGTYGQMIIDNPFHTRIADCLKFGYVCMITRCILQKYLTFMCKTMHLSSDLQKLNLHVNCILLTYYHTII